MRGREEIDEERNKETEKEGLMNFLGSTYQSSTG